jgi:hypothetical protein
MTQSFWQVINNTPFANLPLRDSLHLFKKNVKPIWEDPRNKNGGAWTFRVPKATSFEFWKEILMAAIGEELQDSVEKGDDICGVSISVRFNSHLIMIWNRNGDNQKSIDQILETVMKGLPEEMKPVPSNYYVSPASIMNYGLSANDRDSIRNIVPISRLRDKRPMPQVLDSLSQLATASSLPKRLHLQLHSHNCVDECFIWRNNESRKLFICYYLCVIYHVACWKG